jgi:hypothetical protein
LNSITNPIEKMFSDRYNRGFKGRNVDDYELGYSIYISTESKYFKGVTKDVEKDYCHTTNFPTDI